MYRNQLAKAPPGGVSWIFGSRGLVVVAGRIGRLKHRPALWPADTAVGNITFGRANTATEPPRRQFPMSLVLRQVSRCRPVCCRPYQQYSIEKDVQGYRGY